MKPVPKSADNKFHQGNRADGRHYWLTPPEMMEALRKKYGIDFDPCPFPLPKGFNGLVMDWGQSSYVNPPFGTVMNEGKKAGVTAWVRKAIAENKKGKRVVFVYPVDKWVFLLLEAGATMKNLGCVNWCAIEDGRPGRGSGRAIAEFVLEPKRRRK